MEPAAMRRCDVVVDSPSLAVCEFAFGAMFDAIMGGAVRIPVGLGLTTCCPVADGSTAMGSAPTRPAWDKLVVI
jgi:hypothetical protein